MKQLLWLGSFMDEATNQIMISQGYKNAASYVSVSYTHLDVYKRQVLNRVELDNYLNRKYYYKSYYKSYYAHDDDSAPNRRSIPREKDGAGKRK